MTANDTTVKLGTLGWLWPAWGEGFYPPDMPPEWRLAYYNTQFSCVFLRHDQWQSCDEQEWQSWAEDTHETFLFLLEGAEGDVPPAPLQDKALVLKAGDPRLLWFDAQTDLKALSAQLSGLPAGTGYLLSRDADLGQIERVRTLLNLLGLEA